MKMKICKFESNEWNSETSEKLLNILLLENTTRDILRSDYRVSQYSFIFLLIVRFYVARVEWLMKKIGWLRWTRKVKWLILVILWRFCVIVKTRGNFNLSICLINDAGFWKLSVCCRFRETLDISLLFVAYLYDYLFQSTSYSRKSWAIKNLI